MRSVHPEFGLRQHIYQGAGCISKLAEIIKLEQWKRVMLICGPTLYKNGVAKDIEESIKKSGAEICVATDVKPNPEAATIARELIPAALLFNADVIVAVGGGSTLDTAKGVALVGDSGKRVLDFIVGKISANERFSHNTIPIVAIPTTAGTGSEVCKNAVIADEAGYKLVLAHESILPKYALLDPDLLKTLPFGVAVATAMDTLVQALETLTNRNANDFTQTQSLRSLELIGRSIRHFVANPADPVAANEMSLACMYAGFSLGLAGIGQIHVISHPMSEAPFYLSHGDACAMALPAVIEYNGFACKELYRRAYNALTGRNIPHSKFEVLYLIDWVVRLCDDLHVAEDKSFAQWGFDEDALELMMKHPIVQLAVHHNMPAEMSEYPRVTSMDDFRTIIRRVAAYSEEQAARAAMRKTRVW
jgi:alcohol dehydrogenase class IV